MNDIRVLVRDLVDAAYFSGFCAGAGHDGKPHHLYAIKQREERRAALLAILERHERIHEEEKDTDRVVKCTRCGNVTSSNYTMVAAVGNQIVGPLCPSCHIDYHADYLKGL